MALNEEDKQWIRAELERVETKLLTPFHTGASPVEMRRRSHGAAIRPHRQATENVPDRVKNLEQPPSV